MNQSLESPEKAVGLLGHEIVAILRIRKEKTLEITAKAIGERDFRRVSETIHRTRKNIRIRRKLSKHLGMPYEELWGEPEPKPRVSRKTVSNVA